MILASSLLEAAAMWAAEPSTNQTYNNLHNDMRTVCSTRPVHTYKSLVHGNYMHGVFVSPKPELHVHE